MGQNKLFQGGIRINFHSQCIQGESEVKITQLDQVFFRT
jgi:hypothetical protein